MNTLPKTRIADILEQEADHELLIYDLRIDKMYQLNETAKIVYRACGRQTGFDELKRTSRLSDDLIHFALGELRGNNLLENYTGNHFAGLSRREVVKKVGLASMLALPVVAALIAPAAANAASTCPNPSVEMTTQQSVGVCRVYCNSRCSPCTSGGFGYTPGSRTCTCGTVCG